MKAILYAAKSTEDKRGSIPTQLADGRELAAQETLEIAGEYSDEAASAFHGDRGPQLALARAEAERIAADEGECVLVIQHSDRLARGDGVQAAHLVEYALWAIKARVRIRSIQDPQTFSDLLYAVVTGQRNHEDSKRKSLATADGLKRRAMKGLYTGRRPYGYRRAKEHGLVVVEHEAGVVMRVFTELVAGRTLTAIARGLVADGIPTAGGKALWRQSTVAGIIHSPLYVGKIRHNGEILDGVHQPIVDEQLAAKAQAQLAARNKKGRGRRPKGRHLFVGGLLRCGNCGDAMSPRTDSRGYEFYCCNGRTMLGNEHCTMRSVRRAIVDTAVYRYFEQVALDVEATRDQMACERDRKLAEVHALAQQALTEAQRTEERLARVRRDYADGKLDADDWAAFKVELTAERDAARAEAQRLADSQAEVEQWGAVKDAEADVYRQLSEIRQAIAGEVQNADGVEAVRAALARMFERFIYRGELAGRTHIELMAASRVVIEPVIRERAIGGYSENLAPILRPEPLQQVTNKQQVASGAL